VLVAAIILIVGALIAKLLSGFARASMKAGDLTSANLVSSIIQWSVMVFAVLAALVQLKVASDIVRIVIVGLVAGGSLAFGLSFGLGGKKMAEDTLSNVKKKIEG
jgi:hypothetical protein